MCPSVAQVQVTAGVSVHDPILPKAGNQIFADHGNEAQDLRIQPEHGHESSVVYLALLIEMIHSCQDEPIFVTFCFEFAST